jgi:hypothetical protein
LLGRGRAAVRGRACQGDPSHFRYLTMGACRQAVSRCMWGSRAWNRAPYAGRRLGAWRVPNARKGGLWGPCPRVLRRLFSRASPENSDGPQGLVAGAMWCIGAGHAICRAPCGIAAPLEAILGCCAAGCFPQAGWMCCSECVSLDGICVCPCMAHETVKDRSWAWLSGKSAQTLLRCPLFARKRGAWEHLFQDEPASGPYRGTSPTRKRPPP